MNSLMCRALLSAQVGVLPIVLSVCFPAAAATPDFGEVFAWGSDYYAQSSVPVLTNIMAVEGGGTHGLALRRDGAVLAWGSGGQTNVPAGLSNAVMVAAGGRHSMALTSEGTVVAWGINGNGQTNVPPGLSHVVAISAGTEHSLALLSDGTVTGWGGNAYGQLDVPAGLSNVVALAAGDTYSLALQATGKVVPWGRVLPWDFHAGLSNVVAISAKGPCGLALMADDTIQVWPTNRLPFPSRLPIGAGPAPASATNVVAIAAGEGHALALRSDGQVIAWGFNTAGQTNVPATFSNVTAVAAGYSNSLALVTDGPPFLTVPLLSRTVIHGSPVWFRAAATGSHPLNYQWRRAGTNLAGATNPVLGFASVRLEDAGDYSVVVSNLHGALTNSEARLTVVPLAILEQPTNVVAYAGSTATFGVAAVSASPIAYQWHRHGETLVGATSPTLVLGDLQFNQTGAYSVTVSNEFGAITSNDALLSVVQVVPWGDARFGLTRVPPTATNIVALAGGDSGALALRRDGTVISWINAPEPPPPELTNIVAVAGGYLHALALRDDGRVVAWGNNSAGQTDLPPDLDAVAGIAAGGYHSLALKADGTISAWGENASGQVNVPAGLSNVVAIAGGGYHSLALRADGAVVAWGNDSEGQTRVPAGLSNVIAVACGWMHSVALTADHEIVAWGQNSYGQLQLPPGLTNVTAVACGGTHTLALCDDGRVVAWGHDLQGAVDVPQDLTSAVALAAGYGHSLALRGDGPPFITIPLVSRTVVRGATTHFVASATGSAPLSYQWRFNGTDIPGATGATLRLTDAGPEHVGVYSVEISNAHGTVASPEIMLDLMPLWIREHPASVSTFRGDRIRLRAVVDGPGPMEYQWQVNGHDIPGATHSLFELHDAQPEQSGDYRVVARNHFGTAASAIAEVEVTPVAAWGDNYFGQLNVPPNLTNIVAVAGGSTHSLALRADGNIVAWGDNTYGQAATPDESLVAMAAGARHNLGLTADGRVIAWGDNSRNQSDIPPTLTRAVAVAAGGFHSMALLADGSVVAWGSNDNGQASVPPGLYDVVAVAAGFSSSAAVTADGRVMAWGWDYYGQNNVPPLTDAVRVSVGEFHDIALRADGSLAVWGDIFMGPMPDLRNATAIAAGHWHSAALQADGTVVAWGNNSYGQASVPERLRNVVALAVGQDHNLALVSDRPPATGAVIQDAAVGPEGFHVSVLTEVGRVYALQQKDALDDVPWTTLPRVVGDGGVMTLRDSGPLQATAHRFYRVRRW